MVAGYSPAYRTLGHLCYQLLCRFLVSLFPTPDEENEMKKIPFREALDLLMWLQVATRPDLTFSVNMLARFAHNPGIAHWNTLKHVLTYIKGTKHYGITYKGGSSLEPIG